MKFKVGDKVRVIRCRTMGSRCPNLKEIGTITEVDTEKCAPYMLDIDEEERWHEDELELVGRENQFTKSDLKDGDVVTYRGGRKRIVQGEKLKQMDGNNGYNLNGYRDDLTEKDGYIDLDIIKVERPKYETVFEREEEILDEAEKRYLRDVIRPFRNKVKSISKNKRYYDKNILYIYIELIEDDICLPDFKGSTMYKNMKPKQRYTLEELRTIKE